MSTIAYKGSLASSTMADGGTILIHLAGDYGIHTHTHTYVHHAYGRSSFISQMALTYHYPSRALWLLIASSTQTRVQCSASI